MSDGTEPVRQALLKQAQAEQVAARLAGVVTQVVQLHHSDYWRHRLYAAIYEELMRLTL
jgi:hypothetical protein